MNKGFQSFYKRRNISHSDFKRMITAFCELNNKPINETYIKQKWNEFTSFIDSKIKSGELKGNITSTVNPLNWSLDKQNAFYKAQEYKYKIQRRERYKEFIDSFTEEKKKFMYEFRDFLLEKENERYWINRLKEYSGIVNEYSFTKVETIKAIKLAYANKEEFWKKVKSFKRFQNE